MFASAPMGLTVLCLFQAGAEMEAGARVEARVGETPEGRTVVLLATPALSVDWFAGPDRLRADVSTRILWRPVPLPHARPLFFETFGLTYSTRPSLRSQWNLNLHGSYGEQDYTSLSQQFATQPTLPLATSMLSINATAGASWQSSHHSTLAFRMGAIHRRSLDERGQQGLPTQTSVTFAPDLRVDLSRRRSTSFSVPVSVYKVQSYGAPQAQVGSSIVFSAQPQIQLLEQLTRNERLRVALGFTYFDAVNGTSTGDGNRLTPLAFLGFDSDLYKTRITLVHLSSDLQASWIVDPVLGGGVWRGIARVGVNTQIGLHWGGGLLAYFAEDLSRPSTTVQNDGTLLAADALLRYRWTNVLVAELGARYSERGPRLGSSAFEWRGREVWGFVTLYTASRMILTNSQPLQPITGSGL